MVISQMSLVNEYTDKYFIGATLILDDHLRLLFRAFHYETTCTTTHTYVKKDTFFYLPIHFHK